MGFFTNLFGLANERSYFHTQKVLEKMAKFTPIPADDTYYYYNREHCEFRIPQHTSSSDDDEQTLLLSAGTFSMPSVSELRQTAAALSTFQKEQQAGTNKESNTTTTCNNDNRTTVSNIIGESRSLHSDPRIVSNTTNNDVVVIVQAASQFNFLEMPSPHITPENGIEGYVSDCTQGPACAVACAAGTAYRNYLVPVPFSGKKRGQTKQSQLNGLHRIEDYIGTDQIPWKVKNGYIEATSSSDLKAFNEKILNSNTKREDIISRLCIGIQEDTDVTDLITEKKRNRSRAFVTQTYNSALSIAYSRRASSSTWKPLATTVLDATYEATLLMGIIKALQQPKGRRPIILLTKVGGGVFGNNDEWIRQSMFRAIESMEKQFPTIPMDIRIVHFRQIDPFYLTLERK
mmetsp:Transcript_12156/g.13485  ORF Transcript_12156/g.13485 Transcript_12156/m.13485 type:complete len:403 (-) Transcript_12156:78-1286(-)